MAIVKLYLGATCSLSFGFGLDLSRIDMFLVLLGLQWPGGAHFA